jgi:hypothetical protein
MIGSIALMLLGAAAAATPCESLTSLTPGTMCLFR